MSLQFNRKASVAGAAIAMMLMEAGAGGSAAAAVDAVVPDDFETIQLALDSAGDTDRDGVVHIFVRRGTYAENVLIQQQAGVVLEGQDAAETIIFGTGPAPTLEIEGSIGVAVSGFTITGDGTGDGVVLSFAEVCLVQDNIVEQNNRGIVLATAGGNEVSDNLVRLNESDGIVINRSSGNVIRRNTIQDNGGNGIQVGRSAANRIEGNSILVNGGFGVQVQIGNLNVIQFNQVLRSGIDGLRVEQASKTVIRDNAVSRNQGNGIRMVGTQNSQVNRNAFTSNRKFGVSRQNTVNDDWNATRSGVQNPPGDNRVVGNRAGNVKSS